MWITFIHFFPLPCIFIILFSRYCFIAWSGSLEILHIEFCWNSSHPLTFFFFLFYLFWTSLFPAPPCQWNCSQNLRELSRTWLKTILTLVRGWGHGTIVLVIHRFFLNKHYPYTRCCMGRCSPPSFLNECSNIF